MRNNFKKSSTSPTSPYTQNQLKPSPKSINTDSQINSYQNKPYNNINALIVNEDFISLINGLSDSIREFYKVLKYNIKENKSFIFSYENILIGLIRSNKSYISQYNSYIDNSYKQLEQIKEAMDINNKSNDKNINLFYEDAKILFKKMKKLKNLYESSSINNNSISNNMGKNNNFIYKSGAGNNSCNRNKCSNNRFSNFDNTEDGNFMRKINVPMSSVHSAEHAQNTKSNFNNLNNNYFSEMNSINNFNDNLNKITENIGNINTISANSENTMKKIYKLISHLNRIVKTLEKSNQIALSQKLNAIVKILVREIESLNKCESIINEKNEGTLPKTMKNNINNITNMNNLVRVKHSPQTRFSTVRNNLRQIEDIHNLSNASKQMISNSPSGVNINYSSLLKKYENDLKDYKDKLLKEKDNNRLLQKEISELKEKKIMRSDNSREKANSNGNIQFIYKKTPNYSDQYSKLLKNLKEKNEEISEKLKLITDLNKKLISLNAEKEKLMKDNRSINDKYLQILKKNDENNREIKELREEIKKNSLVNSRSNNLSNSKSNNISLTKLEQTKGSIDVDKLSKKQEELEMKEIDLLMKEESLQKENEELKKSILKLTKENQLMNSKSSQSPNKINNNFYKEEIRKLKEKHSNEIKVMNKKLEDSSKEYKELKSKYDCICNLNRYNQFNNTTNNIYNNNSEDKYLYNYEEEFDLKKMASGAYNKNNSEDINIDYPGIAAIKDRYNEIETKFNTLEKNIKSLLSKIVITTKIKTQVNNICNVFGYSPNTISKVINNNKDKASILVNKSNSSI